MPFEILEPATIESIAAQKGVNSKPTSRLQLESCADLWSQPVIEIEWTIRGLLPKGLYLLADREKGGKSYLAMQVALAVAQGRPIFPNSDDFRPDTPGRVHYYDLEMDGETFKSRLRELCKSADGLERMHRVTELERLTESGIAELSALQAGQRADLIVLDTLTAAVRAGGSTNQSIWKAEYEELACLRDVAHKTDCSILVLHHTNKTAGASPFDSIAGTRARGAATDGNFVVSRNGNVITLHAVTRRTAPIEIALGLFRQGVPGWSLIGDAKAVKRSEERDAILRLLANGPSMLARDIAETLGENRKAIGMRLTRMARDGEVERNPDGTYAAVLSPRDAGSFADER